MERGNRPVKHGAAFDSPHRVHGKPHGDVEAIRRGPDGLADDWQVRIWGWQGFGGCDGTDRRRGRLLCHGPAEEARLHPIVGAAGDQPRKEKRSDDPTPIYYAARASRAVDPTSSSLFAKEGIGLFAPTRGRVRSSLLRSSGARFAGAHSMHRCYDGGASRLIGKRVGMSSTATANNTATTAALRKTLCRAGSRILTGIALAVEEIARPPVGSATRWQSRRRPRCPVRCPLTGRTCSCR